MPQFDINHIQNNAGPKLKTARTKNKFLKLIFKTLIVDLY